VGCRPSPTSWRTSVGPAADVEARRGPSTRFVDLGGRALLPGLIDPHMHFVFVLFEDWIDVSAIATPTYEGMQTKLREGARAAKAGDWVRAWQFDPSITQGAHTPTLAELDALAPDNPFFMLENNGHVAYVNSRALQTTGITRDTPDPPTARFVRGPDGALTGKLEEPLAYLPFIAKMPIPSAMEMRARIRRMHQMARRGDPVDRRSRSWIYGHETVEGSNADLERGSCDWKHRQEGHRTD